MGSHDEHRDRLEAILAEHEGARDVFEDSPLAECGACQAELEAHLAWLAELGALAEQEARMMEEAAGLDLEGGPAEEVFRSTVLAEVESGTQVPAGTEERDPEPEAPGVLGSGVGRARILALVASMLILGLLWRGRDGENGDGGTRMGPSEGLVSPVGEVESYAPFRWSVTLPPGGHFVVILEVDGEERRSPWIRGQEWTPEVSIEGAHELRWSLLVYDASSADVPIERYREWARR